MVLWIINKNYSVDAKKVRAHWIHNYTLCMRAPRNFSDASATRAQHLDFSYEKLLIRWCTKEEMKKGMNYSKMDI